MKKYILLVALLLPACSTVSDKHPNPVLVEQNKVEVPQDLYRVCERPAEQQKMSEGEKLEYDVAEARKLVSCGRRHHAVILLLCRALNCNETISPY